MNKYLARGCLSLSVHCYIILQAEYDINRLHKLHKSILIRLITCTSCTKTSVCTCLKIKDKIRLNKHTENIIKE